MKIKNKLSGFVRQMTVREYFRNIVDRGVAHDYDIVLIDELFRLFIVYEDGSKEFRGVYEKNEIVLKDNMARHRHKAIIYTTIPFQLSDYKANTQIDINYETPIRTDHPDETVKEFKPPYLVFRELFNQAIDKKIMSFDSVYEKEAVENHYHREFHTWIKNKYNVGEDECASHYSYQNFKTFFLEKHKPITLKANILNRFYLSFFPRFLFHKKTRTLIKSWIDNNVNVINIILGLIAIIITIIGIMISK